jgi:predicted nucleic acid-binding protein
MRGSTGTGANEKNEKTIVDTDILVWYFRGHRGAEAFLAAIPRPLRHVSSLTVMELIQGCRNKKEIKEITAFVAANIALVVHPDRAASEMAIGLLSRYALSERLHTIDALIAATAITTSATLATANARHFGRLPGLTLRKFDPGRAVP